jgi:hypothetical protein
VAGREVTEEAEHDAEEPRVRGRHCSARATGRLCRWRAHRVSAARGVCHARWRRLWTGGAGIGVVVNVVEWRPGAGCRRVRLLIMWRRHLD